MHLMFRGTLCVIGATISMSIPTEAQQNVKRDSSMTRLLADAVGRRDTAFHAAVRRAHLTPDLQTLNQAVALASNRGAPLDARITGVAIAFRETFGNNAGMGAPDGTLLEALTLRTNCIAATFGAREQLPGGQRQLRSLTEAVMEDPGAPEALRAVATCVRAALRPRYQPPIDVAALRFEHVCNTQIRVKNAGSKPVQLLYTVDLSPATATFDVPAGGAAKFFVNAYGIVRFWYREKQVGSTVTDRSVCLD